MKRTKKLRENSTLMLMALPGTLWYIIFAYLPMFGLIIAFKNYRFADGIFGSAFVGLKNFEFLFRTNDAVVITRNTVLYNFAFIFLNMAVSITLAIIFDAMGKNKLLKFNQTVILIPHFLSWIVVTYFVYAILSPDKGIANKFLHLLGMDPVSWYSEPKYWPFILFINYIWKHAGYNSIIYYSTIRGFSSEYYEAARIDGATWFQQVRYITLPLLTSIVIMMSLISLGQVMYSDFGLFYLIPKNSGLLYSVTSTIDTYVYNGMTNLTNLGATSAVAFYQSFVGFVLVISANALVRKISVEDALF